MTLQDLFAKIELAVDAAQSKAADVLDKGSAALRSWADWLDAQKAGLKFSGPDDVTAAKALLAKCEALAAPEEHAPKQANGAVIQLVVAALTVFLKQWLSQQPSA